MVAFRSFVLIFALSAGAVIPSAPPAGAASALALTVPPVRVEQTQQGWDAAPLQVRYGYSAAVGAEQAAYHFTEVEPGVFESGLTRTGYRSEVSGAGLRVVVGESVWETAVTDLGRTGASGAVSGSSADQAGLTAPNRVEAAGAPVSSWYVNGPLGLQRGWTIADRPAGVGALDLRFSSTRPVIVGEDGAVLRIAGEAGNVLLEERGLLASDATGRQLEVRYRLTAEGTPFRWMTRRRRIP